MSDVNNLDAHVPAEKEELQKEKKYLIITSSGGGGHINAAEARKAELIALKIPENQIDIIDLMGVSEKAVNGHKKKETTTKDQDTKQEKKNTIITPGDPWIPTYGITGVTPFFSGDENTKKWNLKQQEGT